MRITKKLTLLLTLIIITITCLAETTYYYNGSGDITLTSNWGTNTDGTGNNPNNFNASNRIYEIRNTTSVNLTDDWIISNNSRVVLGNSGTEAITLIIPSSYKLTAIIDIAEASNGSNTLIIQNTTIPTLGTLATGSTVRYEGSAQSVQAATYYRLTINGNGTKTLNGLVTINDSLNIINGNLSIGSNTLTINGLVGGTGTITGSSLSSLIIGESSSNAVLNFTQTSSSAKTLKNFTLNRSNGATLNNSLEITGTVTVTKGTLNANGNLTLISNASGTARIAALQSGASVSGNVTVQRLITGGQGKRRYRYITSPVNNSGSYTLNDFIDDVTITGNGAGYDVNSSSPSAYIYNEAITGSQNTGFVAPATTSTSIPVASGISVFIRGSRDLANQFNSSTVPNNVTLDVTGTINSGTISAPLTYTNTGSSLNDGWNLVGNPYPSQINWNAAGWTKTNIMNTIYIYNAVTGTYGTYNGMIGTNNATSIIPAGQAFFVKATGANPVLTFTENVKTSNTPFNVFRNENEVDSNVIRIKLVKDSVNSDETIVVLSPNGSNNYTSGFDALKLINNTLNIYTKSDDLRNLAINTMLLPSSNDTITLAAIGLLNTSYQLTFGDLYLTPGLIIFLKDNYTGTLNCIASNGVYNFTTTSDPLSNSDSRFQLIFSQSAPLPIQLINFKGNKEAKDVVLNWTSMEVNADKYVIEKSTDGIHFDVMETFTAVNSNGLNHYSAIDHSPSEGINYYKLTCYDQNFAGTFSKMISVSFEGKDDPQFSIYPNPTTDFINITNIDKASELRIIDALGRTIESEKINSEKTVYSKNVQHLKQGIYYINLVDASGVQSTLTFSKN